MRQPLLPPRLQPGDTVGIIHPAGPVRDEEGFAQGLHVLRDFGLQIRCEPPDGSGPDYLAADDRQRLAELHRLWADEEIKALISARGGYGCLRLISKLDWNFLRARPKWLIGFSDLTVLLNGVFAQTGLVTLHGPMISTLARAERDTVLRLKECLRGEFQPCVRPAGLEILRGGFSQGRLVGGNLTTLCHLLGTPWQPQTAGRILFIEDTAEPLYKIDRMLTHLACAGLFDKLSGLILGLFDPGHDDRLEILRLNEQVWQRALELTAAVKCPVWGGFPAGHQRDNFALPVGMEAVMDSFSGSLNFLPQSCRQP
uniref:S66 peptidase family protein n=1 Tax=Candidatus Electronema sp. TaxID=2698783 RepID=UPI0040566656